MLKGIGGDAGYDIWIEAAAAVNSVSTTITSARVSATTFDPISVNPKVVKRENNSLGSRQIRMLSDFQWYVMTGTDVQMNAVIPSEYSSSRFTYKISAPKSTGLQIATYTNPRCTWEGVPSSVSWPAETAQWNPANDRFYLVRCAIGSGDASFTITARDTDHDYEWTLYSLTVKKSWHHADHIASFKFACPVTTIDGIDFKREVRLAAGVWNALRLGVSFSDGGDTSNCGTTLDRGIVSVKTFNAKTETSHRCRTALGCVFPPDRSTYPHFDISQLYIPSEFDDTPGNTKEWTTDLDMEGTMTVGNKVVTKHSMPRVIIHEFGHTAGLDHSVSRSDIMHRSSTDRATPSDFDQEAMKSIYDSDDHSSH